MEIVHPLVGSKGNIQSGKMEITGKQPSDEPSSKLLCLASSYSSRDNWKWRPG
jgi:hypothetical protein